LLIVGGNAADGAGRSMIAGTLLVLGRAMGVSGEWNKRGSIIAVGGASVPATYRYACSYKPEYLRLLWRHVAKLGVPIEERVRGGRFARHCGDLSLLGKGELLLWTAT
jgi:formylmethanofuran dehydrogenase subunit C